MFAHSATRRMSTAVATLTVSNFGSSHGVTFIPYWAGFRAMMTAARMSGT